MNKEIEERLNKYNNDVKDLFLKNWIPNDPKTLKTCHKGGSFFMLQKIITAPPILQL